jgi:hypothetical protein
LTDRGSCMLRFITIDRAAMLGKPIIALLR